MTTANFCCKPLDLQDVAAGDESMEYVVEASVELYPTQYRAFTSRLLGQPPYDVNRYRGGRDNEGRVRVVRITCGNKPVLLCNAEGFSYTRYIALEP